MAGLTEAQNRLVVQDFVLEAVNEEYKLVMLRPDAVAVARQMISGAASPVLVGTVIAFPEGVASVEEKLAEAQQAIADGADELDFVVNYNAYLRGEFDVVAHEVKKCTAFCLRNGKVVKWIIEIAALTDNQIAEITRFIRNVIEAGFKEADYKRVFVKSSTGFYKTEGGRPNGATVHGIKIMLDNAGALPVKAAGGVKSYAEAVEMVNLGVKRIGTSSAWQIVSGHQASGGY